MGVPVDDIDAKRLREAAELAGALDFIEALPEGFDTRIGEGGYGLSVGQRQRISIARALYRDPTVLVLDEATSSLDVETEEAIATVLRNLHGSKTVIVIAHRPATVRHCDRVIRFDHGRVENSKTVRVDAN
jgi:ATP-binding cassette subfamily C protein